MKAASAQESPGERGRGGGGGEVGGAAGRYEGEEAIFSRRANQTKDGEIRKKNKKSVLCLSSSQLRQLSYEWNAPSILTERSEKHNSNGKRKGVSPKMAVGTKGSAHNPITSAEVGGGKRICSK